MAVSISNFPSQRFCQCQYQTFHLNVSGSANIKLSVSCSHWTSTFLAVSISNFPSQRFWQCQHQTVRLIQPLSINVSGSANIKLSISSSHCLSTFLAVPISNCPYHPATVYQRFWQCQYQTVHLIQPLEISVSGRANVQLADITGQGKALRGKWDSNPGLSLTKRAPYYWVTWAVGPGKQKYKH